MLKSNINWESPIMKRHGQSLRLNILKAYLGIRRAYDPQAQKAFKALKDQAGSAQAEQARDKIVS
jgi:hypothetical protein